MSESQFEESLTQQSEVSWIADKKHKHQQIDVKKTYSSKKEVSYFGSYPCIPRQKRDDTKKPTKKTNDLYLSNNSTYQKEDTFTFDDIDITRAAPVSLFSDMNPEDFTMETTELSDEKSLEKSLSSFNLSIDRMSKHSSRDSHRKKQSSTRIPSETMSVSNNQSYVSVASKILQRLSHTTTGSDKKSTKSKLSTGISHTSGNKMVKKSIGDQHNIEENHQSPRVQNYEMNVSPLVPSVVNSDITSQGPSSHQSDSSDSSKNSLLHTPIRPRSHASSKKSLLHTPILPRSRVISKKSLLHTTILSRSRVSSKKSLLDTPILSGSSASSKKSLHHTTILSRSRVSSKKSLLDTPILSGSSASSKKSLHHTTILSGSRVSSKKSLLHTPILPRSRASSKKSLLDTPILSGSSDSSKKSLHHIPILPRSRASSKKSLHHTPILPMSRASSKKSLHYTPILPMSRASSKKSLHHTPILPMSRASSKKSLLLTPMLPKNAPSSSSSPKSDDSAEVLPVRIPKSIMKFQVSTFGKTRKSVSSSSSSSGEKSDDVSSQDQSDDNYKDTGSSKVLESSIRNTQDTPMLLNSVGKSTNIGNLVHSFGVDLKRSLSEKKTKISAIAEDTLNNTHRALSKIWHKDFMNRSDHQNNFEEKMTYELEQLSKDVNAIVEHRKKSFTFLKEQVLALENIRISQQKRLKKLQMMYSEFYSSMRSEKESSKTKQKAEVEQVLKQEMNELQRKLLEQARQQEMQQIKNRLRKMLA